MSLRSAFAQIILDVESVEKSVGFYRDKLGFAVRSVEELDGHRLAYLSANGFEILLLEQPLEERAGGATGRGGGLIMNFRVSGLREAANDLKQQRVQVLQDLEEVAFGDRTLLIADPNGYTILLSEPVGTVH